MNTEENPIIQTAREQLADRQLFNQEQRDTTIRSFYEGIFNPYSLFLWELFPLDLPEGVTTPNRSFTPKAWHEAFIECAQSHGWDNPILHLYPPIDPNGYLKTVSPLLKHNSRAPILEWYLQYHDRYNHPFSETELPPQDIQQKYGKAKRINADNQYRLLPHPTQLILHNENTPHLQLILMIHKKEIEITRQSTHLFTNTAKTKTVSSYNEVLAQVMMLMNTSKK